MKNLSLTQVVTHLATLIIGLGIGYATWSGTPSNNVEQPTISRPPLGDETTTKGIDTTNQTSPDIVNQDDDTKDLPNDKEPEPADTSPDTKSLNSNVSSNNFGRVNTGISDKKIGEVLSAIAKNLEDKTLEYRSDLLQDCSGIYHQMKDSLQSRLPALKEGAEYQYPSSKTTRNTRQIADWFNKRGNLHIVQDPMASRNYIRPGSVMFYSKSGKKYTNIDIDMLTDRANNYTSNGAIMHIATVTNVKTDAEGNVLEYTIMHGRRPGRHAKRTGSKEVQSTNTPGLPKFGHWTQQWVAVANITTPK